MWGVSATLGRAAFTGRLLPKGQALRPIDPLILSQSRTTFSFIVLLIALVMLRGWNRLRLPVPDFRRMFVLGILGVAASNYLYYLAIQRTNVATAIILQYTAPILVLLYTVARGLQKPTVQRIAAVGLAVTGIALVIGIFGSTGFRLDAIGVIAALGAAFSFAFYNVGGHSILAVMTVGPCCFTSSLVHLSSGSLSTRRGKSRPRITRLISGYSCSCFRWFPFSHRFRFISLGCSIWSRHARSSSAVWSPYSRL